MSNEYEIISNLIRFVTIREITSEYPEVITLSKAQKRLVTLEAKKEEFKRYKEELNEVTEEVAKELGVDGMFQDPDTNLVYQVIIPEGKFVYFDRLSTLRTKKVEEKRGSLSKVKAEAAGYKL